MRRRRLTSIRPNGQGLFALRFDSPAEHYVRPGQYVTATTGALKPSFFAIASQPDEPLELLIKDEGETAHALCSLEPGAEVETSEAQGNGFPLAQVADCELVILCNGSAMSACRPVVRSEIAGGLPRPVHLYYGVMSPLHAAYADEFDDWVEAGVHVHLVVDPTNVEPWDGETGFVQDVSADHGLCRADVGLVLAGVPPMIKAARSKWADAGCPEERMLTNF